MMCRDPTMPYATFPEEFLQRLGQGRYPTFEALYYDNFVELVNRVVSLDGQICLSDVVECEHQVAELVDREVLCTVSSLTSNGLSDPVTSDVQISREFVRFRDTDHACEYTDDIDEVAMGLRMNRLTL